MSILHSIGPNATPKDVTGKGSATASAADPILAEATEHAPLTQRLAGPRSAEEAEERYVVARDAWIEAMRAANSGRPADLASLAIAQETYEHATAEAERWRSGGRVAIPIEAEPLRADIEVAIGQQLAWQRVRDHEEKPRGVISRVLRRVTRRD